MKFRSTALLLAAVLVLAILPATAGRAGAAPVDDHRQVVELTYPTDPSRTGFGNSYDAARSGGRVHKATDIMGAKLIPIYAAVAGVIVRMPISDDSVGYRITIRGDDGRSYSYIHLNNDHRGTDDGKAGFEWAYAPGLMAGDRVVRGQHIAFMGDSGNAESTQAHLHFAISDPSVTDPYGTSYLDPAPSLRAAIARGDVPRGPTQAPGGCIPRPDGAFYDVTSDSAHRSSIAYLARRHITEGVTPCRFSPATTLTRLQMASLVARMLDHHGVAMPATPADHFDDDEGSTHETSVNQLVEVGVLVGDTGDDLTGRLFRGTAPMKRDQMAAWIARAYQVMAGGPLPAGRTGRFDDVRTYHVAEIEALAEAGIVEGYEDGTYRPHNNVRRDQMASYLARTSRLVS